jgi:Protein of unknown function (DUF3987)
MSRRSFTAELETDDEGLLAEVPVITDSDFWTSREILQHIRDLALSRVISPWGLLGYTLALTSATTDHTIVLPGLGGSLTSMNIFTALIAPTGGGKGETVKAGHELVEYEAYLLANLGPGTGEGFLAGYTEAGVRGNTRTHYNAFVTVDEVRTLGKIIERPGSTVEGVMCSAWAGEMLAFQTSDKSKRRMVDRFTYRMGMGMGVQPTQAGPFIRGVDQGLTQRFLWLPTREPQTEIPEAPDPMVIKPPRMREAFDENDDGEVNPMDLSDLKLRPMRVPPPIMDEIAADRLARTHDSLLKVDLNSHRMQQRLRVAGNLAVMDGRSDKISTEDWQLAEAVVEVSDQYRDYVVTAVGESVRQANVAAGKNDAARMKARDEQLRKTEQDEIKRVANVILRKAKRLARDNEKLTNREASRAVQGKDRHLQAKAMVHLVAEGSLSEVGDGKWEVS